MYSLLQLKVPLGLTGGMAASDAVDENKIIGSGKTALIISNEEMEDSVKIFLRNQSYW